METYTLKILVKEERYYRIKAESIKELYENWSEEIEDLKPVETNIIREEFEYLRNDNPNKKECIR